MIFQGILPKVEPTAAKVAGTANQLIGEEPNNGKSLAISQNQVSFILLAICILTNHWRFLTLEMIRLIKNVPAVPLYCHNTNKYLKLSDMYLRYLIQDDKIYIIGRGSIRVTRAEADFGRGKVSG